MLETSPQPEFIATPTGQPTAGVFLKQGEYWTVGFAGNTILLRDTKGLQYLARLLVEPSQRISVIALAAEPGGPVALEEPRTLERARSAVTKRIRDAIQKIAKNHPQLGRHLLTRVKTGYECRYLPDPDQPIDWQL